MDSKDEYTRKHAIEALMKLKEHRALLRLIELLATDESNDVREAALEALAEITGQNFGWNWQKWQRWYEKNKDE
jgi:HEAT repeat protein